VIRRRRFLHALAAGASGFALPASLVAQPRTKRVAVFVMYLGPDEGSKEAMKGTDGPLHAAWASLFANEGFRDGLDVKIVIHVARGRSNWEETLPKAAGEVARGNYDVVFVSNENLLRHLQKAAPDLPIVTNLDDPVRAGFARSLSEPGGNVTGTHGGVVEVNLKQIELLRRILPGEVSKIAWISFKPQLEVTWPAFAEAAKRAKVSVRQVLIDSSEFPTFPTLRRDFAALGREGCVGAQYGGAVDEDIATVAALALQHRIAVAYVGQDSDIKIEGLLFQYRAMAKGFRERHVAAMAKILRGQKPGTIPFEGPNEYVLRINMRTAERIGVKIPSDVQLMANELLR